MEEQIEALNGHVAGLAAVMTAVISSLTPQAAQAAAQHLQASAEIDGEAAVEEGASPVRETARLGICNAYIELLRAVSRG